MDEWEVMPDDERGMEAGGGGPDPLLPSGGAEGGRIDLFLYMMRAYGERLEQRMGELLDPGFSALGYPVASRIDKILSKLCFGSLFFILFAAVPLSSYEITSNS